MGRRALVAASFLLLSVCYLAPLTAHAATGQIYLTPATASLTNGASVSLQLRITPGTSVNAVSSTITYNPNDLSVTSVTAGFFSACPENSAASGTITVDCASLGSSTSTDSLVDTIVFQALVGSGSAGVTLAAGNAANNGVYTNPGLSGATITFTTPAASPPTTSPAPTNPSSNSSTKASSQTSGSTKASTVATTLAPTQTAAPVQTLAQASSSSAGGSVTVPKLLSMKVSAQLNLAVFSLSASNAVSAVITYGTAANALSNTLNPLSIASTKIVSQNVLSLSPATTYYYRVRLSSSSGGSFSSPIMQFKTKGYSVTVSVFDSKNQLLRDQTVSLAGQKASEKTNANGQVTFASISPGLHFIAYLTPSGTAISEPFYVTASYTAHSGVQTPTPETAGIILDGYTQNQPSLAHWWELVLLTALLSLLFYRRRDLWQARRTYRFGKSMMDRYSVAELADLEAYIKVQQSERIAVKTKAAAKKETKNNPTKSPKKMSNDQSADKSSS